MIPSHPSVEDLMFISSADVILLAGGDTTQGWRVISNRFNTIIKHRYNNGAIIMGISAGAIQLGLKGFSTSATAFNIHMFFDTVALVPVLVDVHDEENDWKRLEQLAHVSSMSVPHLGISFGGAAAFFPDNSIMVIEKPMVAHMNNGALIKREFHDPGSILKLRKHNV